jgi:hypothetical protein
LFVAASAAHLQDSSQRWKQGTSPKGGVVRQAKL